MTACPVPSTTNFSQPFVLEYASGKAIGALLMQKGHPIPFESRKLREIKRLYSKYV